MPRTARKLAIAALGVCLAAGLVAVTSPIWLKWIGAYLVSGGPPCKADMIIVLDGDYWGNRVLKAAELQRDGWAPQVLVSGAGAFYGVNEADLAIQFAVHKGFPAGAFIGLPSSARSTVEEARCIIPELRRRKVRRFILVTSDYHTHRAASVYRREAPDLPFCVVASSDPDFSADRWWRQREGRKTAFFEWCKTIGYTLGL